MNGAPDEGFLSNESRATIEQALELFSPRIVQWEEEIDVRIQFPQACKEEKRMFWRFLSQWNFQHYALNLMVDFEKSHKISFDWVMLLRPDLVRYYSLKPYCGFDQNILYDPNVFGEAFVPYGDWFRLIRGDIAVEAFDVIRNLDGKCDMSVSELGISKLKLSGKISESTKREKGISFMPGYIVRHCNYGNLLEFCSYMTDKRYFVNEGECGALLHAC